MSSIGVGRASRSGDNDGPISVEALRSVGGFDGFTGGSLLLVEFTALELLFAGSGSFKSIKSAFLVVLASGSEGTRRGGNAGRFSAASE